jgi:hypothetical protein
MLLMLMLMPLLLLLLLPLLLLLLLMPLLMPRHRLLGSPGAGAPPAGCCSDIRGAELGQHNRPKGRPSLRRAGPKPAAAVCLPPQVGMLGSDAYTPAAQGTANKLAAEILELVT